jgi:hypothetical protein
MVVCPSQPLDVTKTRLQLDKTGRYNGMVDCGVKIYQKEGAAALYKGLSPFVAHLTLKYALRFGTFGFFKKLLGAGGDSKSSKDTFLTFNVRPGAAMLFPKRNPEGFQNNLRVPVVCACLTFAVVFTGWFVGWID